MGQFEARGTPGSLAVALGRLRARCERGAGVRPERGGGEGE